jgi:phosphate transport system substrate-binding protein
MTDEEIAAVKNGVVLLAMTGSVVLAYNLPGGPAELKLSRDAYVGIFLGKPSR